MIGKYLRLFSVSLLLVAPAAWLGLGPRAALQAQQQNPPAEVLAYADLVLYGGNVLTADDRFTIVQAVAIRDGRFLATGSSQRMLAMAGPNTRRIDLKGKTIVPGFIDSHQHLHDYATSGKLKRSINFFKDTEAGLRALKELVDQTPPGEWVVVSATGAAALYRGKLPVTRQQVDAIAPKHPVAIFFHPGYAVNSAALRLAALPQDTLGLDKDPQTGEPTGWIEDQAAGIMEQEVLPWEPMEKLIPLLKTEMLRENAAGLTTVCTRLPGNYITALKEIWSAGELTMRWRVNHELLSSNPRAEAYLKRVGNLDGFGDRMLKISGVFLDPPDSAFATGGEWTSKPKLRIAPGAERFGPFGKRRWADGRSDRKNAVLAIRYGWSVLGTHSAGDRANTEVLAAYEEGKRTPIVVNPKQRLGIDHGPMLTPEHLKKIKELGVIPSLGMKYVFGQRTENAVNLYGADAVNRMTPLKSALDLGIRPALEADIGEAPYFHPLWQIEKTLTRKDEKGRVWGIQEAIKRQEALFMYTKWAARYTGDEESLGTIEPGKLADLAVLDGDYMTVAEDRISEIPVVMTVVGGEAVYEAVGASGNQQVQR